MSLDQVAYRRTAEDLLVRWGCVPDGEPFFTESSLLWPVTRGGRALMLKCANPHDDEAHAGAVLAYYGGEGAVALVEGDGPNSLLERLVPAEPLDLKGLVLAGRDDDATNIIFDIVAALHRPRNRPLPSVLHSFRSRSESMRRNVESGRVTPESRELFARAYPVAEELAAEDDAPILLHGDIHHFNILHSRERGWLAIDPKGILGPRAYDYANSLCNPYGCPDIVLNSARMERQARIIAERAGLDLRVLLRLTFLHGMQVAAWCAGAEEQNYWIECARIAASLGKV